MCGYNQPLLVYLLRLYESHVHTRETAGPERWVGLETEDGESPGPGSQNRPLFPQRFGLELKAS